jgi:hypothetical protein|tara:strand:- start:580 stop:768 length:189 start_codon:yes stop_codon:yes gene_type:complete
MVPNDLLERLKYVDAKGIKIVIICREKDLKPDVRNELKQLRKLDLRYDEDLHAKCFYSSQFG